jgi:hypothetical protein
VCRLILAVPVWDKIPAQNERARERDF